MRVGTFRRPGATAQAAIAIGLFGAIVGASFSWVPSLWYDEAATVTSATRSLPELFSEIQTVDAVHGVYYALMHVWLSIWSYSPLALRLPSAIATGIAAGLLVILVTRLADRRTAIIVGIVFTLLPRVTWMATEGRSYALSTLLAILSTLVFVVACSNGGRTRWVAARWWILYAAVTFVSGSVFLYLALLVPAHAVAVLWQWISRRRSLGWERTASSVNLTGFVAAAAVGLGALVPLGLAIEAQGGQLAWIHPLGKDTWAQVFIGQWFLDANVFAIVGWIGILAGLAVVVFQTVSGWRHTRSGGFRVLKVPGVSPNLLQLTLPWLIIPTIELLIASVIHSPLYSPRYETYCAPAAAIFIGVGIAALRRRWLTAVALLVIVGLAVPQIVSQRQPEAKQFSSWSQVAALIAKERAAEPDGTVDAIIYGPVRRHATATTRVIAYSYPNEFKGMVDVTLKTPAAQSGRLWEYSYPLADSLDRLDGTDVAYLVTSDKRDRRPATTAALETIGYKLVDEWHLTYVNILRYERVDP